MLLPVALSVGIGGLSTVLSLRSRPDEALGQGGVSGIRKKESHPRLHYAQVMVCLAPTRGWQRLGKPRCVFVSAASLGVQDELGVLRQFLAEDRKLFFAGTSGFLPRTYMYARRHISGRRDETDYTQTLVAEGVGRSTLLVGEPCSVTAAGLL